MYVWVCVCVWVSVGKILMYFLKEGEKPMCMYVFVYVCMCVCMYVSYKNKKVCVFYKYLKVTFFVWTGNYVYEFKVVLFTYRCVFTCYS